MHETARNFLDFIHNNFPEYFHNKVVLDVGSADINGNNRMYFTDSDYTGNDVYLAPNVTIVCKTCELPHPKDTFDTIVSSECFEHDMQYKDSFRKIVEVLKPNGLFAFTCASTNRNEHGTRRSEPHSSYTTRIGDIPWSDYYKNLTAEDVVEAIPCDDIFSYYSFYYNEPARDLYFYGFKKGDIDPPKFIQYKANGTEMTRTSV